MALVQEKETSIVQEPLIVKFVVIAMLAVLVISLRVFAGQCDRERLREFIRNQGGELLEARWSPFGSGWVGEKGERLYEVKYRDGAGRTHSVTVKTSRLTGVFLTGDQLLQQAATDHQANGDSASELRRLRERLAELEKHETSEGQGNA